MTSRWQLLDIVICLLAYYATVGIMAIGFGTMFAGGRGAGAAARFFFWRPIVSVWQQLASAVTTGMTAFKNSTKRAIANEINELAADVRWLLAKLRRS